MGMRRSSPMPQASKRALPISSSSGATLSQSRSLPTTAREESPLAIEGRVFRRAVSDRARLSAEGAAGGDDLDAMDVDSEFVAPRRQIRKKGEEKENGRASKSPRHLRYEKVARSEDLANARRSGESMFSPATSAAKDKSAVEVPCEQTVGGNVLRKSWSIPVAVKVEPEEEHENPVLKGSRQLKQKAAELLASIPTSFSFSGRSNSTAEAASCRIKRRVQVSHGDWLQRTLDVMLWKDLSRSSLIFGAGSFAIVSTSFMQDIHLNIVTTLSYLALVYLSAVFFRINILRRPQSPLGNSWKLKEEAALEMTKEIVPAVNAVLVKLSHLFSGDPKTTLKVAAALWCLAHIGYWMSLWNIFRFAFFGAFFIPKCYVSYSTQLHDQGNHLLSHLSSVWESCSHKKVVVAVLAILLWKFLAVSSRLWIAFFAVVGFRQYQTTRSGLEAPLMIKKEH